MANGVTKKETTEIQKALVRLYTEGFLKLPAPPSYLPVFMNELAQEYKRLRADNPGSDKFQTLQTAVENARKNTQDPMVTSSVVISLSDKAPGVFFGTRSINPFLKDLA